MLRNPLSVRRASLLAVLLAPLAAAQVDFSIATIEVNQAVQTGSTPLVAGRSTFVRTAVRVVNPGAPSVPVDGLLRIFVDGVETEDSPLFSDNGPFPATQVLNPAIEDGTLNFIFIPPASGNVVLEVEVNPPGPNHVPESFTANNTRATGALSFGVQKVPELQYAPIDYRPSGGTTPNLPDPALTQPGVGDNFIQGIYPAAEWYYRRTDAPSKLWTSSLSGSGSSLLNSLQVDINLMVPKPDFLYGWVPGPLPGYNGQAFISGNVSMGNTELVRFQRTIAHELGHNFGLQHNTITTNVIGVDVEHHLNQTQSLPQIKGATLKDIMYAGLLTQEAWVWPSNYNFFHNHAVFNLPLSGLAGDAPPAPRLMVAGTWNTSTGAVTLTDVLTLPAGTPSAAASPAAADLVLRAYAGGELLQELPVDANSSADECPACGGDAADSGAVLPEVAFHAVLALPGSAIDRLVVAQAGARAVAGLELPRSAAAPQVALSAPAALAGGPLTVSWEVADADGDVPTCYLTYSPDGTRVIPLLGSTRATQHVVDPAGLPRATAGAYLELLASDGLHTTAVRAPLAPPAGDGAVGNAPWVEIYAPDDGFSYLQGANVILHSSGWDLEDRALTGADIAWSSDVDGALGTGRLLAVDTLSPGSHVISVTATDSDGNVTVDSATISVAARGLPTIGGDICQADLGFGGPGGAELSLCGGDLSTGTTADLALGGAPAGAPAFLVAGLSGNPTPFKGGTLVPFPWNTLLALATDGAGELTIAGVPGGGGPLSLYIQAFVMDGSQPQGFTISNALRADFLP